MHACVPPARCRDGEWNDRGTERWSEVGSTESRPTICLRIDFLVGRRSAEPLFVAFAAPVLQHSMSEWRIVILRPSRKFAHVAPARFYFGGSNNRSLHFTTLTYVGRAEPEWRAGG